MKTAHMVAAILVVAAWLFVPAAPALAREQRIVFNLGVEPKTLDPHQAQGEPEGHVILNVIEGLTRTDAQGHPVPAIAERWETSDDGLMYRFFLREARWSHGAPVTADDFVFGWRRCLAPETAGPYAYQLFFVAGAEDYNSGKVSDPAAVAVRAVTSRTLEVRLRGPAPFFPAVLAHYAYSPLPEAHIKAHPDWARTPEHYPSNGPFRLTEWRHNDRLTLVRNPEYYAADRVRLETLVMTMITNESTALLQWEAGALDILNSLPLPDIPRLMREGKYRSAPFLATYYVLFNHSARPFDDPRVRRAFSLAIDRDQITSAILRGGQQPARALVPPGIEMAGGDFRATSGDLFRENADEARRLLAEAGYPGGRRFPRVKYLYNDREDHRLIAQALQGMWLSTLGVRVDLDVQDWKVFLQNRKQGNYQFARAGWIGDYLDPVNFLDMYTSNAGNNDAFYKNPEFDRLIAEAGMTADTTRRVNLLREAEAMLIGRDMAVAPIYFYVREFAQKPHVKGVVRNPVGNIYFDGAFVEP